MTKFSLSNGLIITENDEGENTVERNGKKYHIVITGLWTNFDLNGPGPVGEPEPARAPNSDKLQSNPDY